MVTTFEKLSQLYQLYATFSLHLFIALLLATTSSMALATEADENLPPVAHNMSLRAIAGSTVPCTIKVSDDHKHSKYLWVTIIDPPQYGQLQLSPRYASLYPERSYLMEYTAHADAPESDFFTFEVSDGEYSSELGRCNISIDPSSPPVVNDMNIEVVEGAWNHITLDSSDPDNRTILSTHIIPESLSGTIRPFYTWDSTSKYVLYRPNGLPGETESFRFQAYDGNLTSTNIASCHMTVIPSTPPTTQNINTTCMQSGRTNVILSASDSETTRSLLTYEIVTHPSHGALIPYYNTSFGNYIYIYTPEANYIGTDSFTYRASDGLYTSETAQVTITVSGNTPPVTWDQQINIDAATTTHFSLEVHDPELGPQRLICQIIEHPDSGVLSHANPESPSDALIYEPDPTFSGDVTFTFRYDDGIELSDIATCTLQVKADNPATTFNQTISTRWLNQSINRYFAFLDDDWHQDAEYIIINPPHHGTVQLQPNGNDFLEQASFTYTPNKDYRGQDSFTWQRRTAGELSEVKQVTLNIGNASVLLLISDDLLDPLSEKLDELNEQLASEGYRVIQQTVPRGISDQDLWQTISGIYQNPSSSLSGVMLFGIDEDNPDGMPYLWDMRHFKQLSKSSKVGVVTTYEHHIDIWVSSYPRDDPNVLNRIIQTSINTKRRTTELPETAWVTTTPLDSTYNTEVLSPLWPEVVSSHKTDIQPAADYGGDFVYRADHNGIPRFSDGVNLRVLFISGCKAAPSLKRELYRDNSKAVLGVGSQITHSGHTYKFAMRVGNTPELADKARSGFSWGEIMMEMNPKHVNLFGRPYAGACFIGDLTHTVLPNSLLSQEANDNPPRIASIKAHSNQVWLTFSEPVLPGSSIHGAERIESYQLDNNIFINQARLMDDGKTVILNTFPQLVAEKIYTVTVNDIRDRNLWPREIPSQSSHIFKIGDPQTNIHCYDYDTTWPRHPNFSLITPQKSTVVDNISLSAANRNGDNDNNFALRFVGLLQVPEPGRYHFGFEAIWHGHSGARARINGHTILNKEPTDKPRGPGWIDLNSGFHTIELNYFTLSSTKKITLLWGPSRDNLVTIPASHLWHINEIPLILNRQVSLALPTLGEWRANISSDFTDNFNVEQHTFEYNRKANAVFFPQPPDNEDG